MALADTQRTALSKAVALGLAADVRRVRFGEYRVPSTSQAGVTYTVTVGADNVYRCTCKGAKHPACVHRAAVYLAKLRCNEGVQVLSVKPAGMVPSPVPAAPRTVKRVALV